MPEPLGPIRPKISARSSAKLTPSSARTPPNAIASSRSSSSGPLPAAASRTASGTARGAVATASGATRARSRSSPPTSPQGATMIIASSTAP